MSKLKIRIAEVSYPGSVIEIRVAASSNVEGADLVKRHLGSDGHKNVQVRSMGIGIDGEPRILNDGSEADFSGSAADNSANEES